MKCGTEFSELNPTFSRGDKDAIHFGDRRVPVGDPTRNEAAGDEIETGIGVLESEIDVVNLS